ncbi:hypothetical protein DMA11_20685 [Marinilabiliaceae bacterium JC017]|nr:hypothetical protein DMA11_20685 [Marinilabiliaceae bacterium JC017]
MKIRAYTIPELIIVMVITSFLVMSLWGGYRFVVKQFYYFNVRTEKYENLMQIDNLLRNDFLKARAISYEQGKRLVVDLKNKKRVQYIFEENVIIRLQDGITDYFNFDIESKQVEYLYIGRNMTSNVISLFIELFVNNRKVDLFYSKSYDRQFYIQSQTSY